MFYNKKPKLILFDVGGTLFADGKCNPSDGFEKLCQYAVNPNVTNGRILADYWNKYLSDISKLKSESGENLDIPLSSVIKYATMNAGLVFDIPMEEQEEIFDRFNSERRVIEGVEELLEKLHSLGIKTAVISNNMMSGKSLSLALKRWIPSANFEFVLTSSDILYAKPSKEIFLSAVNFAGVEPSECWYCGDSVIPDVYGSSDCGMNPVLLDINSSSPLEFRSDENADDYLAVNSWKALNNYISDLKD